MLSKLGTLFFTSVDPNDQKKTACYDIDVEVDDTLKTQMNSFLLSTASQQEIAGLDNKVQTFAQQSTGSVVFSLVLTFVQRVFNRCVHGGGDVPSCFVTSRSFFFPT